MVLPLAYSHIYSLKLCPNFMIEVIMSLWISDKPVPYMKGSQCCFIPNTKYKYHLTRFWQDGRYSVTIFLWGNICRNYSHKNNTRRIHRSLPWPLRSRNRQPLHAATIYCASCRSRCSPFCKAQSRKSSGLAKLRGVVWAGLYARLFSISSHRGHEEIDVILQPSPHSGLLYKSSHNGVPAF